MSQSVDLLAGSYNISFQAAQCANEFPERRASKSRSWSTALEVGLITPVGTSYGLYETSNFTVAAGTHTIQFLGTNPQGGNNTALIDLVSLARRARPDHRRRFRDAGLGREYLRGAPSGTPWQFSGLAGVSTNGSGVTTGNATAPQGTQVGFLMNNGSMSYSVYLDADTYNLSFLAAQRAKYQTQSQEIEVLVDGAQVGLITPSEHHVHALRDVEFHGRGRNAHHPVPRFESARPPTAPPSSTR